MMTKAVGEYVDVNGISTFYIKKGTGTPIVMIHGGSPGACARVNFGANIDFLADAGYTVHAYDQPGYGRSDAPEDYSLEYRVGHAHGFLKAMGIQRCMLMGNSQGSYIAARLALELPGVEKMVLASSGTLAPAGSPEAEKLAAEHAEFTGSYEPSLENMRTLSLGTLFDPKRVTEEFVQERYENSIGKAYETQQLRKGTPRPRSVYGELKNLNMPVLLLWGANDTGVALERSLLLFQAIPGAELHIFDRAAHWVQWDKAERFNTLVRDFLQA